jgi:hypothetical protein
VEFVVEKWELKLGQILLLAIQVSLAIIIPSLQHIRMPSGVVGHAVA